MPPQNLEAEQATLGSMLLDPDAAKVVLEILSPKDFYREAHQIIFQAMKDVSTIGTVVDMVTVGDRLREIGKLEEVGGGEYQAALTRIVPMLGRVETYAGIVLEKSLLRQVARYGEDLTRDAYDSPDDVTAFLEQGRANYQKLYERPHNKHLYDIDAQELPGIIGGTGWLYKPLLARGYLTLLVANPFVGKSVTAYRLALSVIGELPYPGTDIKEDDPGVVCWAEAESAQQSIVDRIAAWGLTRPGIRLAGTQGERRFSIPEDLPAIRSWLIQNDAKLFIGDSLRNLFSGSENSSRQVKDCLLPLAEMLRDLNIPGLLVHHSRKSQELEAHVFEVEKCRGSSVIYAIPRIVVAMDLPDRNRDTRRLFVSQSNIGPSGDAWGVDIDLETGLPIFTDDVPEEPREKMITRTCKNFLEDLLAFGPARTQDILEQGREQGFRQAAVYGAASSLPVYRRKVTNDKGPVYTMWSLTPFPEDQLFTDE